MNTTLKPALTSSGPQNPPVPAQLNKPVHPPQAAPNIYGQPQGLVNSGHNNPIDHSSSNQHAPTPAHQGNHFSSSTNSSHYPPVNAPSAIPPVATTHPTIPNVPQQGPQSYVKSTTYAGGEYQPNLGHPPNNPMPPVIQNIPATQHPQPPPPLSATAPAVAATPSVVEKPQSNGTPDVQKKTPEKAPAPQENHVSSASPKIPAVQSSPQAPPKAGDAAPPPAPSSAASNDKVDAAPEAKEEVSTSEKAQPSTASNNQMSSSTAESTAAAESNSAGSSGTAEPDSSKISPSKEAKTEHVVAAAPTAETTKDAGAPKEKTPSTSQKAARVTARKSRTPKNDEDKPSPKAVGESKVSTTPQKTAGKSKRMRIRTQPYQSPLPEIEIITKISSSAPRTKNNDDKLIVFYKNEFLAVRNSEGSFYVCQAVQNIYKSSPKIKIRWLSQDKNDKSGEIYTPDFYDVTDFDCILTNLNLTRIDKGKFRLPAAEKERTDSILKRSLAVEKGEVSAASLTEEHPDGIDLSLYKEESQLKKRKKATKRKASSSKSKYVDDDDDDDEDEDGDDDDEEPSPKVRKVSAKRGKKPKESPVKKPSSVPSKKTAAISRIERAKKRGDAQNHKVSPITVDHKKAKVLAKVVRKTAITSQAVTTKPAQSINKNKTKPTPPASKKIPPKPVVAKKGKKSARK